MGFMFSGLDADKYDRQYSDTYLFQRLWSYLKPYRRRVWGVVLAALVMSGTQALPPILLAFGVELLQEGSGWSPLLLVVGALLLTALFGYFANWGRRRLLNRVIGDLMRVLREDALKAAVHRDMAFYDENKSGKILSRITSDTEEMGQVLIFSSDIISRVVMALILVVVLLTRNAPLTLVTLSFTPIIVSIALIFRRLARNVTRQGSRAMAMVNDKIQETVSGISIAKNFRREGMIYDEFVDVNTESYTINMRRGFVLSLVFPVLNALGGFAVAAVVYVGALQVVNGVINAGDWYLYLQAVDYFWFPFLQLAAFGSQIQQALSAVERIFALIDAENTVQQNDDQPVGKVGGDIRFDDITFGYTADNPVLSKFDLHISPGESVAFVGHTGAGKSTIIKLITRFYEFQQGHILIDGRDIRSFDFAILSWKARPRTTVTVFVQWHDYGQRPLCSPRCNN